MHAFHGRQLLTIGAATLALASTSACRHHQDMQNQYTQMRQAMVNGDWATAVAQYEGSKDKAYNEDDRVMFWLNLGTLYHYAGDAAKSNEYLVKAEGAMQELWTKSISSEASKLAVSETIQAYEGEDFEKVLVYLFTSINNVNMNKVQDALVEARRADELLKKMLVHYEKEGEDGTKLGTLYKQDAFMLWLVGAYYELEGKSSLNDAFLAYKAAYKSYAEDYASQYGTPRPKFLGEDLVRTAKMLGFQDEAQKFAQETGATGESADKLAQGMSELIVIHGNGEAPRKEEFFIDGVMPDGYVMRIALPQFRAAPATVAYAEVTAGDVVARTELAEPITEMVLKNFEFRLPAIKLRAIARATVKYVATKAAKEAAGGDNLAGSLVGLAGNVASAASEAADLRSWTTLPGSVGVARVWLPAGQHTVKVAYHTSSGAPTGRIEQLTVNLKAGERRIVSVRSLQ
jgi:uncharacterized protein